MSNKIAATMKYPELQSNNYNELAEVAQRQGDFQKAFEYFTKIFTSEIYEVIRPKIEKRIAEALALIRRGRSPKAWTRPEYRAGDRTFGDD